MTYGLAADLHFHPWSAFSQTLPDGQNSRLVGLIDELKRCAREVYNVAGPLGRVYLAGDVFHVRGAVAPMVLNAVKDGMRECVMKWQTRFIIMPGNHDLEGKDSTRLGSAVTALEEVAAIHNEVTVAEGVAMVPWFEKVEDLKAAIEEVVRSVTDTAEVDLLLHAPIDGVIEGLPAHGLTPEYLAALGFKRVFAGHYHNHKEFPGHVYSIGALAHHTWSDVSSKAGFLLVGPGRVDVHWHKSHLPAFVDLDKLDVSDELELEAAVDRNFVRVKVDSGKVKDVEASRSQLTSMGALGVLVMATPEPPKREGAVTATVSAGASLEVSIGEFVKTLAGASPADVMREALSVLSAADALEV